MQASSLIQYGSSKLVLLTILSLAAMSFAPVFAAEPAPVAEQTATSQQPEETANAHQPSDATLVLSLVQQSGLLSIEDAETINAQFQSSKVTTSTNSIDMTSRPMMHIEYWSASGEKLFTKMTEGLSESDFNSPTPITFKLRLPWIANTHAIRVSDSRSPMPAANGLPDDAVVLEPFFRTKSSTLDALTKSMVKEEPKIEKAEQQQPEQSNQ